MAVASFAVNFLKKAPHLIIPDLFVPYNARHHGTLLWISDKYPDITCPATRWGVRVRKEIDIAWAACIGEVFEKDGVRVGRERMVGLGVTEKIVGWWAEWMGGMVSGGRIEAFNSWIGGPSNRDMAIRTGKHWQGFGHMIGEDDAANRDMVSRSGKRWAGVAANAADTANQEIEYRFGKRRADGAKNAANNAANISRTPTPTPTQASGGGGGSKRKSPTGSPTTAEPKRARFSAGGGGEPSAHGPAARKGYQGKNFDPGYKARLAARRKVAGGAGGAGGVGTAAGGRRFSK
jgi:hypothetical protein